ncbi:MAG: lipoyl synthase [Nitrospirae bacterium]|nr:lipoyl synthase [Nitrospirota bacterium]
MERGQMQRGQMKQQQRPEWLRVNPFRGTREVKRLLRSYGLSTVCEEARCPNRGHCFAKPTATFMILGSTCTRNCGFCCVHSGHPLPPDESEPDRVALASESMGLKHVIITSVTRDDLPDGGAAHFAKTVESVRKRLPGSTIEVLTPDFRGDAKALYTVLDSRPDVFNHNVETVPALYPIVRPQADYRTSLNVLKMAGEYSPPSSPAPHFPNMPDLQNLRNLLNLPNHPDLPDIKVKSGLMVGLGERFDDVVSLLGDLRESGCHFVTIGQYLRPKKDNLPVVEFVHPEVFERLGEVARSLGFLHVASGPLVRSSMDAGDSLSAPCAGDSFPATSN